MAWRETLLKYFGPGLLGGVTFGDWLAMLGQNRFRVAPTCIPRALGITWQSMSNSFWRWRENRRFGKEIEAVEVQPPLFLLGHYRNGTTHLHNLLAIDERFAYPNNYQVFYPHTFLSTESFQSPLVQFFMPRRRPMDNIEWTLQSPQEDEFALQVLTGMSPCMGWTFPSRREHYDQYLTFRDAPRTELDEWQRAFMEFMRKLTWKYRKPLVLKSPPHTARIALLLQLFPQAKFVHIHRNPYAVFPSWKHTITVNMELQRLQNPRLEELDEYILSRYRAMYDAFFDERGLIPAGRYCEIGYEELERDPMGVLRSIYTALDLPDLDTASPALLRYLDSIAGYQKNEFRPLPESLRQRIRHEWRRCFEEWGYDRL
jgi:omega-hydroxy-beta-dihydromenaquinone-9 sulfotransferase